MILWIDQWCLQGGEVMFIDCFQKGVSGLGLLIVITSLVHGFMGHPLDNIM